MPARPPTAAPGPTAGTHQAPASVTARWANVTWLRWTLWLLLAGWFLAPVLSQPYLLGKAQDWAYFNQHATSAWLSWTVYGELPQWEPFSCGGIPAIGNLQGTPVGLTQLCAALFGLMPGQRIASLLFVLLGLEGGFRYARHRGAQGVGALAAGVLFAFSGRFVQLFHDGQPVFLSFELLPWALLCLERGWRQWRFAVAGAGVMTLLFLEGGAVPTPLVSVLLGLVVVVRTLLAVGRRITAKEGAPPDIPWWRPAGTLALMGGLTLALTVWRILPVAESLIRYPRVWHGVDTYTIGHVLNMILREGKAQGYVADGSGFVGMGAAMLFGLGLMLRDRRAVWPLLLTVLCLDLATGTAEGLGLFVLLKAMPVLENLRNPFRFGLFAAFFIAVGAGVGVTALEERLVAWAAAVGPRWHARSPRATQGQARALRMALTVAVAVVGTTVAMGPSWQVMRFGHDRLQSVLKRPAPRHVIRPFRQSIGNRWVADEWPAQHRGSLSCFEEQPFPQAPGLRADRDQEAFLVLPEAGTVTQVGWSPHRITLQVDLRRPARLLINQNFHRAWRSSVGTVSRHGGHKPAEKRTTQAPGMKAPGMKAPGMKAPGMKAPGMKAPGAPTLEGEGLIAIDLPAGRYPVVVRFANPLILGGLGFSALTLLLLAWISHKTRRDGR